MISEIGLTEEEKDSGLVARERRNLEFESFVPGDILKVNLDELLKVKDEKDIKEAFAIRSEDPNGIELHDLARQTQNSMESFIKKNSSLALDPRFCDKYNYRVSSFYKNLHDYEKERVYLSKIHDRENPFYKEKIAENLIRTEDSAKEGLATLEQLGNEEGILYMAAYWRAKKEYKKARSLLEDYYKKTGPSQNINSCIITDCIMQTGEIHKAIHLLRESFFFCRMSDETALLLSVLYYFESLKNKRLLEKSGFWAKTAFSLNNSSQYALSMVVRLYQERESEYVKEQCNKYLKLPSNQKERNKFYPRAILIKAKSFYIQKKYADCIEVLQELTGNEKYSASAWNNIAICNEAGKQWERALKNLTKAVQKAETDNHNRPQIYANYINLLSALGKWNEAVNFFESSELNSLPSSKAQYLDYFSPYIKSLFNVGQNQKASELLWNCFNNSVIPEVKNCAAVDIIRDSYINLSINSPTVAEACKFLMQNTVKGKQRKQQNLNDAVFTILERGEEVSENLFKSFVSSIGKDPYSHATFGLYLFRVKDDPARGAEYYTKAMQFSDSDTLYEELRLKCRYEIALNYIKHGMERDAKKELEGIIKKCPEEFFWYKKAAQKILAEF